MTHRLLRDVRASTVVEFAMLLPLLMTMMFAIIDAGRFIWIYNRAEKATQVGARMAVVTNYVSSSIASSYVGQCSPALVQGDVIPASCFSTVTCTSTSCSSGTLDSAAFTNIVSRMQKMMPELSANNVTIEYSPSGLGYAGSPIGTDVSPLVTVKIGTPTAIQFKPLTAYTLLTANLPTFTTTLTAEDLSGAQSN